MHDRDSIRIRTRLSRKESGHSILELAFVMIPMLVMMLGILDVSLVVFLKVTLAHATREGTRLAITQPTSTDSGTACTTQLACIVSEVQSDAFGFLAGQANLITVNYYAPSNLSTPLETCNAGACTANAGWPSGITYANQPGNVVEVAVTGYPWNWLFPVSATSGGLTSPTITLNANSIGVLGPLAAGTTTPPAL